MTNKWTPLFASNFLSVFNDNLLKYCIIFIAASWKLPDSISHSQLIALISGALIIPYLFFSPLAGFLAAHYSKRYIFIVGKILEIATLILACAALLLHWLIIAAITVLIMGTISCLYSPSKYGLIRDIGGQDGVSFGSGVFEMMSFAGILTGTVSAALLSDLHTDLWPVLTLIAFAVAGLFSTSRIKTNESPVDLNIKHSLNPILFILDNFRIAKQHKHVNNSVFGASVFWLIGSLLQMTIVIHTQNVYKLSNTNTGAILAIAAIGIALGTFATGKLSGNKVNRSLLLWGLAGMILFLACIIIIPMSIALFTSCIFAVCFFGGIFQIPSLATIQGAPLGRNLGNIIGYLNMITFALILIGAFIFSAITKLSNENSYYVFGAILSITVATFAYFLIPAVITKKQITTTGE